MRREFVGLALADERAGIGRLEFLHSFTHHFTAGSGGEFGQFLGAIAIPGAFMLLLAALPFIDRSPERNIFKRPIALLSWTVVMIGILVLTVSAIINREFLD